jgi:hypothetical protein
MARNVFFSFNFNEDFWRTQQVRNIGSIDGNKIATANKWEEVKKEGDEAVKRWINKNMKGKSCVIVLVGSQTAGRKWINYEIERAWNEGKGVAGIRIHNLKDKNGYQSYSGSNPFEGFTLCDGKISLSSKVALHSPSGQSSKRVYRNIKNNIGSWIEGAIQTRQDFRCP